MQFSKSGMPAFTFSARTLAGDMLVARAHGKLSIVRPSGTAER